MSLYLAHFGLESPPFRITPGTEFFYEGARRGETVNALVYAIESGEGMIKIVGEVGSGKTMLCRVLMERLPAHVQTVYLAVPSLTRDEILDAIADDLGLVPEGRVTQRIKALQNRLVQMHAEGKRVVLIIDEAHAMPVATLEEIRLLSNLETGQEKLLQIVMFGQPELDSQLASPNMRQLRERITQNLSLAPLPATNISEYVDFRLRRAGYKGPSLFSADALAVIAEASEGLSRRINIFADKTLLAAFAAGTHTVTADHARAAIADMPVQPMPSATKPRPQWFWPVLAAAGMALAGVGFWIGVATSPRSLGGVNGAVDQGAARATGAFSASANDSSTARVPLSDAVKSPPPNASQKAVAAGLLAPQNTATADTRHPYEHRPTADVFVQRWQDQQVRAQFKKQLEAGRAKIQTAPPTSHFVLLWAKPASEHAGLVSYSAMLEAALPASDAWYAPLRGTPLSSRTALLLGPFATREAAQKALGAVPRELTVHGAQVRSATQLQAEVDKS